jgi:hypothetical protein
MRINPLPAMKIALNTALMLLALHTVCHAQNFPDRIINYDPLGDHTIDTAGFTWLGGARLHAEFGRYSNGSGRSHRWNAKTGGSIEVARWDSTWSIALAGTTEITIDPNNDISFNPRAICWEEGILVSHRIAADAALQFGGFQRCKHDIDNLESAFDGAPQERTLIFSGATLRLLLRPRPLIPGSDLLWGGIALRNELYVHILDDRISGEVDHGGRGLDGMVASQVAIGRLELRPWGPTLAAHLSGSVMASWFGERFGILGNDAGKLTILGSTPHLEIGLDVVNPRGGSFTFFARGEWQRDAAILPKPGSVALALFGVRFGDFATMW